jgi:hypothetical protein
MTVLERAIRLVKRHQKWRRGADIPMSDPKELGVAIDCLIEAATKYKKIRPERYVCKYCGYDGDFPNSVRQHPCVSLSEKRKINKKGE